MDEVRERLEYGIRRLYLERPEKPLVLLQECVGHTTAERNAAMSEIEALTRASTPADHHSDHATTQDVKQKILHEKQENQVLHFGGEENSPWKPGWITFFTPDSYTIALKQPTMVTKMTMTASNFRNTPKNMVVSASDSLDGPYDPVYNMVFPERDFRRKPLPGKLEGSMNTATWYVVGEVENDAGANDAELSVVRNYTTLLTAEGVKSRCRKAQYWRVDVLDNCGGLYVGINNFQIYGVSNPAPPPHDVKVRALVPERVADQRVEYDIHVSWEFEGTENMMSSGDEWSGALFAVMCGNPPVHDRIRDMSGFVLATAKVDERECVIRGLQGTVVYEIYVVVVQFEEEKGNCDSSAGIPKVIKRMGEMSDIVTVESPLLGSASTPAMFSMSEDARVDENEDHGALSDEEEGDVVSPGGESQLNAGTLALLKSRVSMRNLKGETEAEVEALSSILKETEHVALRGTLVGDGPHGVEVVLSPQEAVDMLYRGHMDAVDAVRVNERVCLFLSSTFEDTTTERNYLMQYVFPMLSNHCREYGLDFSVVDLRWGVRGESTDHHDTIDICESEVERCVNTSAAVSFVFFSTQRYGWVALPKRVPKKEMEEILKFVTDEDALDTLAVWYSLDTNKVDPEYLLQPISRLEERKDVKYRHFWDKPGELGAQSIMQRALWTAVDAAENSGGEESTIGNFWRVSVTEREVWSGCLQRPMTTAELSSLCIIRTLEGLEEVVDLPDHDHSIGEEERRKANSYCCKKTFERDNLYRLRDRVRKHLPESSIREYSLPWRPTGVTMECHGEYVRQLAARFAKDVQVRIRHVCETTKALTELEKEIRHHLQTVSSRERRFFGRNELVKRFVDTTRRSMDGQSQVMVVEGVSGSGKTSLMCVGGVKAAEMVRQRMGGGGERMEKSDAVYVIRMCGTSEASSTARAMLLSVCQQIIYVYSQKPTGEEETPTCLKDVNPDSLPNCFDELVRLFRSLLSCGSAHRPLMIFIDSLDQLSDDDKARSQPWTWLPKRVPPFTTLCVSTLPDQRYGILRQLKTVIDNDNFVTVPKTNLESTMDIIKQQLLHRGRSVNQQQWEEVERSARTAGELTLLHMSLITDTISKWHSYDPPTRLPSSVYGLIESFYCELERAHGQRLVKTVFSLILASRSGLSFENMLDIISGNDALLGRVGEAGAILQYHNPPLRRLPPLVLKRLLGHVGEYMVERGSHGVIVRQFYHRQFVEAAERMYFSDSEWRSECCQMLIDYFSGDLAKRFSDRQIDKQPLYFTGNDGGAGVGDNNTNRVNVQRLSELTTALKRAQQVRRLAETICSLDVIQATFEANSDTLVSDLLSNLLFLKTTASSPSASGDEISDLADLVREMCEFAQKWAHVLSLQPDLVPSLALCSPSPILSKLASSVLEGEESGPNHSHDSVTKPSYFQWVNKRTYADPMLLSRKLDAAVTCVKVSAGAEYAAASYGTECAVYDLATGLVVCEFSDFKDLIQALALSTPSSSSASVCPLNPNQQLDDRKVAFGGRDRHLHVFRFDGSPVWDVKHAHDAWITGIEWLPQTIVTSSADHTLRVWGDEDGQLIKVLEAHSRPVTSIAVASPPPQLEWTTNSSLSSSTCANNAFDVLVSASTDGSVCVWDTRTWETCHQLVGSDSDNGIIRSVGACWFALSEGGRGVESPSMSLLVCGSTTDRFVDVWTIPVEPGNSGESNLSTSSISVFSHPTHASQVLSCCAVVDGTTGRPKIISGGTDSTLVLTDVLSRKKEMTINSHASWVLSVCGDLTGRTSTMSRSPSSAGSAEGEAVILSASSDTTFKVWSMPRLKQASQIRTQQSGNEDRGYGKQRQDGWMYRSGNSTTTKTTLLSNDGSELFILHDDCSSRTVAIPSLETTQKFPGAKIPPEEIGAVSGIVDGHAWVIPDLRKKIHILVKGSRMQQAIDVHTNMCSAPVCAVHPDNGTLAVLSDFHLYLFRWNGASKTYSGPLFEHKFPAIHHWNGLKWAKGDNPDVEGSILIVSAADEIHVCRLAEVTDTSVRMIIDTSVAQFDMSTAVMDSTKNAQIIVGRSVSPHAPANDGIVVLDVRSKYVLRKIDVEDSGEVQRLALCEQLGLVVLVLAPSCKLGTASVVAVDYNTGERMATFCHVDSDPFLSLNVHFNEALQELSVVLIDRAGDIVLLKYRGGKFSSTANE